MIRINRVGKVYGDLTVVAPVEKRDGKSWWRCVCSCGNETVVRGGNLNSRNTKSCGCKKNQVIPMEGQTFGRLTVIQSFTHPVSGAKMWLCACVCGSTHRVLGANLRAGNVTSCGCLPRGREFSPNWKGGRRTGPHGYVRVYARGHKNAACDGYIMEHRLVMSEKLGRPLLPDENVHHINGIKTDNRVENLELWTTSQPSGKRVADAVAWAEMILERYRTVNQDEKFNHAIQRLEKA